MKKSHFARKCSHSSSWIFVLNPPSQVFIPNIHYNCFCQGYRLLLSCKIQSLEVILLDYQHEKLSTSSSWQCPFTGFPGYQGLLVFFASLGAHDSIYLQGGEHTAGFSSWTSPLLPLYLGNLIQYNGFKYHLMLPTPKFISSAQLSLVNFQFTSTFHLYAESSKRSKFNTNVWSSPTKFVLPCQ